jgi:hypothetical protein
VAEAYRCRRTRIAESYNDSEIAAAGLLKEIRLARNSRDEKIRLASKHLAILGVTADDLRVWIRAWVLGAKP